VHLFERFGRLHREYVMKAGSPDEELSQVAIAGIEGYFRSHPLPEERVNQLERIIAAKKWASVPEKALKVRPEQPKTTAVNQ
jgi:predicted Zn-dependent protease